MIGFFLKRRVTLFSVYAIIIVLGIISIINLPVELFPEQSYPSLQISVTWSGSSPVAIEKNITRKIESEIYKLQGIRNVESISRRDICQVNVEFEKDVDMDYIKILLSEALSGIDFPEGSNAPTITENLPDELQREINPIVLSVSGPYSLERMGEVSEDIKLVLERVNGVKKVDISGNPEKTINIQVLDPTVNPYIIAREFIKNDEAVGEVEVNGRNISISLINPSLPEDIKIDGKALDKVAYIEYSTQSPFVISRINGNPIITINIEKRKDIGLLEFSNGVRGAIGNLELDEGVEVEITRDESDDIRDNMKTIGILGLIALVGVSISFLFTMRNKFSVLIFSLTILFSSMVTIILLYFTGFSINVLTISGIALAFGLVVDNSIIVMENILRLKEEGIKNAERKGASEVFLPVLASTLTTISVFLPFLFFQKESRQFYIPFAVSASFTLLASIFVSFTLIPTLSKKIKPVITYRPKVYEWVLKKMIWLRYILIPLTLFLILSGFYIFKNFVDRGSVFSFNFGGDNLSVIIILPEGAHKSEFLRISEIFEHEIKKSTTYENFYTTITPKFVYIDIDLKEINDEAVNLKERLQSLAVNFANCTIIIRGLGNPFRTGSGFGGFAQFQIKGYDYYRLGVIADRLRIKLEENPRIKEVDADFSFYGKQKEYIITPLQTLPLYGLYPSVISGMLRQKITIPLIIDEGSYTVNIFRDSLIQNTALLRLPVKEGVELRDVCMIDEEMSPAVIERENQQYIKAIAYDFLGPNKMASNFRVAFMNSAELPEGYSIEDFYFGFDEKELNKKDIIIAVLLALFLLMAILSSLYESFAKPLLILLVLPVSFFGVALIYYITKSIFNSSAFIGLILLLGIAVNDGIVLIDHLSKGKKKTIDEIVKRSGHRFRPILITTITTLVGLLPFAFMKSDIILFSKLSISCLGGLVFSTIGSLFILPVVFYTFMGKKKEKRREECRQDQHDQNDNSSCHLNK